MPESFSESVGDKMDAMKTGDESAKCNVSEVIWSNDHCFESLHSQKVSRNFKKGLPKYSKEN